MVSRAARRLAVAAGLAAAVAVPFEGYAQNRDTLETKVTAEGGVVALEWSKNHPWSQILLARGASIVAEYRTTARGVVSEVLGSATTRKQDERAVRFRLPDTLAAPPVGPVCLLIQLPDRKLLPLRKANKSGDDTSRFRYEDWEKAAARQSEATAARARLAVAERDLGMANGLVSAQQALSTRNKWESLQACQAISVAQTTTVEQPFDAVPPAEQDDVARRVCVSRVAWAESELERRLATAREKSGSDAAGRYLNLAVGVVRTPAVVDQQLQGWAAETVPDDGNLQARLKQADQFRRDWERWSAGAATYLTPHVGERGDTIPLQSTASDAAFRIFGTSIATMLGVTLKSEPKMEPQDRPGYVGGSLEAYSRCVVETRSQLNTKYDNWIALRSAAPARSAMARDQLIAACRDGVTKLEQLKASAQAATATVDRERAALASASVPLPIRDKTSTLNFSACSPQ